MDWDAARYEEWFTTREGRFALGAERRLLDSVVAEWPRRNQRVLEIGCGTGLFQHILFDDGFSVAGLDKSPGMIDAARKRLGPEAELYVGDGEVLPFADKEYDFCVLWTVLEFCEDPGRALAEAARVAAKGLLIGFLNRHSAYWLARGCCWPMTCGSCSATASSALSPSNTTRGLMPRNSRRSARVVMNSCSSSTRRIFQSCLFMPVPRAAPWAR